MNMQQFKLVSLAILLISQLILVKAAELSPAVQAKIDAKTKEAKVWATDPVIIKAVTTHNSGLPGEQAAMTQDKWKELSVLDPFVRTFSKNEAATFLKSKQGSVVSEAFISGADGLKVAFLSKPTNWSHKGKEKHETPMAGKNWQGPIETDVSSGQRQIQVSVPVLDDGKAIGSLVIGLSISKLESE